MARRKRREKESGFDLLVAAPWQVSAIFSFMLLSGVLWIFPALAGENPILKSIMVGIKPFGYLGAGIFGFIAGINYLRQRNSSSSPPSQPLPPIRYDEPSADLAVLYAENVAKAWEASSRRSHSKQPEPETAEWSLDLLKRIEWKRFEELCAAYFRELGLRAETIRCGADGGVDAKLFRGDAPDTESIIQCKAWNARPVGVKPVRELFGVMAHQKVRRGIFLTTSTYTKEAQEFATENPIFLVNGEKFFGMIGKLPEEARQRLLSVATSGDYLTPTCPSCGIKMVKRNGPKNNFWGCLNYPRCKQTFVMRETSA